jgi:hypothetical protein
MMAAKTEPARPRGRVTAEGLVRRTCTLVVAGVAAYATYQHQREYALVGGSDLTGAALWPLSVDGLLILATVGVLTAEQLSRRGRIAVWLSFWLGIAVSLAANIAAVPTLAWQPMLVAGWPPVALLLAVELLAHSPRNQRTETVPAASESGTDSPATVRDTDTESAGESDAETAQVITLAGASTHSKTVGEQTAQEVMWAHVQRELSRDRIPTGAELDRVAGTNNYGRTVLRQWRTEGRIPPPSQGRRARGGVG